MAEPLEPVCPCCGAGLDGRAAIVGRDRWQGVDRGRRGCGVARPRGRAARRGTLATVPLEPEGYDAAVFQHSLEHVTDPVENLERTRAGLKPGGVVAMVVPNFASWQRRHFGGR